MHESVYGERPPSFCGPGPPPSLYAKRWDFSNGAIAVRIGGTYHFWMRMGAVIAISLAFIGLFVWSWVFLMSAWLRT